MSLLRSSRYWRLADTFFQKTTYQGLKSGRFAFAPQVHKVTGFNVRSYALAASTSKVDLSIKRLDNEVRRSGRVTKQEVIDLLSVCTSLKRATSTQALMVIRCCGNLLPDETPASRIELVDKIWKTFENLGVPFDVSHYNALLRVYNENKHKFSPSDFLSNLQSKGIEPNRVTFQHLVATYCQLADLGGAQKILEYMKEKGLPINKHIFGSLIDGHSRVKDMESARGILSIMSQANMEPDAEIYTALMCGYARNGDLESLMKVLQDCESKNVDITDKDLLEVCLTAAESDQTEIFDKILTVFQKKPGFNQDAKNCILRLISHGKDASAIKLFKAMPPISDSEDSPAFAGNFVIKHLLKNKKPVELVVSLCNDLVESGSNKYAFHNATEISFYHSEPEVSLALLSKLAQIEPASQHYYWPMLVKFGKEKNLEGIISTLRQLSEDVGTPPTSETLRDYVIPYLSPGEKGIHELRQAGISMASAAASTTHFYLTKNKIKEAANIALLYKAQYSSAFIRRSLVKALCATGDVDSFMDMLRVFQSGESDEDMIYRETALLDVLSNLKTNREIIIPQILEKYLEAGQRISSETADEVKNKLSEAELTDHVLSLLGRLTASDLTPIELKRPPPRMMVQEKDETNLIKSIEAVERKGDSALALKRRLLTVYCHKKDLEKAEALKKEMEQAGFEFNGGLISLLMDLYAAHDKLEEAKMYYDQYMKTNSDDELDESKVLRLACAYIKHDLIEDAIALFQRHQPKGDAGERGNGQTSLCWKILNTLAEKGDKDALKRVFDVMKNSNFLEINNIILGPLIKVHILKDDIKSALDQFEECATLYRMTPWKNELTCRLIQSEDAISLQRLTDLSTQIHGEVNSLYDLVLAFVECGRIRQARKILETPGLKTRTQRLKLASERYLTDGKLTHLENLIEATKDFNHIDRSYIYTCLLKAYCNDNDVDKAFGLWTRMQEENVQPSEEFLAKLAAILQQHNRPVPFVVPALSPVIDEEIPKQSAPSSGGLKALRRAIYGKFIDEATKIYHSLRENEITIGDRSRFLNLMVNCGRVGEASKLLIDSLQKGQKPHLRSLSYTINHIAKAGDIDSLNIIGSLIDESTKKFVSFSNRLTHCMVEAGRASEVLDLMEKSLEVANTPQMIQKVRDEFPRGGIYSIFELAPDLLPRFEELSQEYLKKGIFEPVNILWIYYSMAGNKEKADKYMKQMVPGERLMFQPILKRARRDLDITALDNLMAECKAFKVSTAALASIHSAIIDSYLQMTDIKECEKRLDVAMSECEPENLNRNVLLRAKRALEERKLPFKYTIPPKRNLNQDTSDSSSSSDSDSETEAAAQRRS